METTPTACDVDTCENHFHSTAQDDTQDARRGESQQTLIEQRSDVSQTNTLDSGVNSEKGPTKEERKEEPAIDPNDRGFGRIVRNFTPSYVLRLLNG